MIEIKVKNGNLILSFPKDLISSKYISRFIERLEMEKIAQKAYFQKRMLGDYQKRLKRVGGIGTEIDF